MEINLVLKYQAEQLKELNNNLKLNSDMFWGC